MPTKGRPLDRDYLVREYLNGRSGTELALELGWGKAVSRIYNELRRAGVAIRPQAGQINLKRRVAIDLADLVRAYEGGASVALLSRQLGCTRKTIASRLREAGVALRGRHDAELLKWRQMRSEDRERQIRAAHAASTGRTLPDDEKRRRALTIQARGLHISAAERQLRALLSERGIETIPQQAIGPYNCDLGAEPVAVEVWGGNWHWTGRHITRHT
ncbi:MAG TPA: hypothetical protein VFA70_04245, partial [Dehalococcoidia bacterium]|nr:hypothetical protein [Dehalococcoidia bacterium]